ncbi:hypothetical protein CASFOL_040412 [Castilleja foliolosa]|uniref:Uncharacterized protein n=1 Tax=Castilleja foliolosa TaxID=1961234 RepID=A0ABD3BFE1_9LAMI
MGGFSIATINHSQLCSAPAFPVNLRLTHLSPTTATLPKTTQTPPAATPPLTSSPPPVVISLLPLHATSILFGVIKDVKTPIDLYTQKHCSFGFVIFLDKKVVVASMENMDNAELYGCVLTVNYAPTEGIKGGEQGWSPNPSYLFGDAFEAQFLNLAGETQVVGIGDETQVVDIGDETQVVDIGYETQVFDELDCMKNMSNDFLNDFYTETVATDGKCEGANKIEAFFETQDRSVAVLPRSVLHQGEPPVWRPVNVEQLITITEQ